MVSQIGSIAISLAGGLIFSSYIFLGLFKKFKNQTYLQVAERSILATSYCIFLAFFCLLNELLISNFNLQYVAQYTSYETPVFYKARNWPSLKSLVKDTRGLISSMTPAG